MSSLKKFNGTTWEDSKLHKLGTSTDTITTLPAVIYPNDTTATVGLKGNTAQNGTPTPQNPVMPNGTGERTGNLFDFNVWYTQISPTRCIVSKTRNAITITATGNDSYTGNGGLHVPVESDTEYTFHFTSDNDNSGSIYLFENGIVDSAHTHAFNNNNKKQVTFTTLSDTTFLTVRLGVYNSGNSITYSNIMLNAGSTALPYEPYGYKLDISSANTTTPVYLGEVETTRRIKKLVLTGQETRWNKSGAYQGSFYLSGVSPAPISLTEQAYCSHAEFTSISTYAQNKFCFNGSPINLNLWIGESSWTTDDFKTYLTQQYSAGTPVTVWYVLANPETAVVNEPIRKLGDYADEVANVSIPVTVGGDTLSVDTTVQPSEVAATYKGWHPVLNVHEKSKNLFDKSDQTQFYARTNLAEENRWVYAESSIGIVIRIPCLPNTQYTINCDVNTAVWRLAEVNTDDIPTTASSVVVTDIVREKPSNGVYTFTTNNGIKALLLQVSSTAVNAAIDCLMLNTGGSALPYEPYWK